MLVSAAVTATDTHHAIDAVIDAVWRASPAMSFACSMRQTASMTASMA
jgi:hypothetical protein